MPRAKFRILCILRLTHNKPKKNALLKRSSFYVRQTVFFAYTWFGFICRERVVVHVNTTSCGQGVEGRRVERPAAFLSDKSCNIQQISFVATLINLVWCYK